MPDIISLISRRWKLIWRLTLIATGVAFIACLLSPKKYVGIVTALPANSMVNDKARIFNQNIEALYPELGSPDELDKIEGTAKLDTIFLAVAKELNLTTHYSINTNSHEAIYKAALDLRKNTTINRTGFGELRIKVWDKENNMAATLANALLQKLNDIHQRLQTENKQLILQQLKEAYASKQQQLFPDVQNRVQSDSNRKTVNTDTQREALTSQLQQYTQLINEYELSLKTTPKVLLVVENARPSPWPDKPKIAQTVLLAFLASLLFSILLALFIESRNQTT